MASGSGRKKKAKYTATHHPDATFLLRDPDEHLSARAFKREENMDRHFEIDPPMALRDLEEKVSKLQATVEQQDSRVKQLERVMLEFIQLLRDQMGLVEEKMDQRIMDCLKKHQQACPNPAMHQSPCPKPAMHPRPINHQSPCPNLTIHQSPHPGPISTNQRAIPSPHLNPKTTSSSESNSKSNQARKPRIFTNLGMPLSMALGHLVKNGHLNPLDPKPLPNPLPRKCDLSWYCAYHQTPGHTTNHCMKLRHDIQDLIEHKIITPLLNPSSDVLHDVQSFQSQPLLSTLKEFVASMNVQQPTGPDPINRVEKGIDNTRYELEKGHSTEKWSKRADDVPTKIQKGNGEPEDNASEVIVFRTAAAKANVDALGNLVD